MCLKIGKTKRCVSPSASQEGPIPLFYADENVPVLHQPSASRDHHNQIACPGFERSRVGTTQYWQGYGSPYQIDATTAHTGERSLKLSCTVKDIESDEDHRTGAQGRLIYLDPASRTVKLSAWTKTEALTPSIEGREFAILVRLRLSNRGYRWYKMPCPAGTHDWQYTERKWKLDQPAGRAQVFVKLHGHTGTAWVDDLFVGCSGR